ncbi:putative membrane protein [Burkholderia thailandensis MSMB121]|uniref:hypothetical protein n=1 Tax=Burkholderia humptydooensis TaxID=430531 RepID=UPI000327F820|nr:hypothetical protein [Burkholderia humptydooensis]AGK49021.1 putative membrane protein [Burkholderia thailandensis MSMB121]
MNVLRNAFAVLSHVFGSFVAIVAMTLVVWLQPSTSPRLAWIAALLAVAGWRLAARGGD